MTSSLTVQTLLADHGVLADPDSQEAGVTARNHPQPPFQEEVYRTQDRSAPTGGEGEGAREECTVLVSVAIFSAVRSFGLSVALLAR